MRQSQVNRMRLQARKDFHEILTPEGIAIKVEVPRVGTRINAYVHDFVIQMLTVLGFGFIAFFGMVVFNDSANIFGGLIVLYSFVIRKFYFVFFEIRWKGKTPGKKNQNIQVINRHGGTMTNSALMLRNLIREIEFSIPFLFIVFMDELMPDAPWYLILLALIWMIIFPLYPFFNKKRLRIGDLVAGTIVVHLPQTLLLEDIAQKQEQRSEYHFTEEQLSFYGRYELQTLENIIQDLDLSSKNDDVIVSIYEKIAKKIGWRRAHGQSVDEREFLRAFYIAQRAHLEKNLLMGRKKERKS